MNGHRVPWTGVEVGSGLLQENGAIHPARQQAETLGKGRKVTRRNADDLTFAGGLDAVAGFEFKAIDFCIANAFDLLDGRSPSDCGGQLLR